MGVDLVTLTDNCTPERTEEQQDYTEGLGTSHKAQGPGIQWPGHQA